MKALALLPLLLLLHLPAHANSRPTRAAIESLQHQRLVAALHPATGRIDPGAVAVAALTSGSRVLAMPVILGGFTAAAGGGSTFTGGTVADATTFTSDVTFNGGVGALGFAAGETLVPADGTLNVTGDLTMSGGFNTGTATSSIGANSNFRISQGGLISFESNNTYIESTATTSDLKFLARSLAATGDESTFLFSPTINKADGNYTALKINVTETSAPGADDRLIDLQVGGVSKWRVSNSGAQNSTGFAVDGSGAITNVASVNSAGFVAATIYYTNSSRLILAPSATFGVQLDTTGAKVAADATNRGSLFYEAGGAGVNDRLYLLSKDGANVYAYKDLLPLKGSAVLDFPNTLAGAISDLTVTVTDAALGDAVTLGVPNGSVAATSTYFGWVSAADTVTIRHSPNGVTADPASGTFKVQVTKQ